ncbi:hypothetical protein [Ilumatobacter nonamiensis]|uniref:hypothetical protein n=1 Tax=Ilumatobacter nonamiensis TaxID=467093 RepID=UPI00034C93C5|nr:hypothetical protein [Ilumatobacter nonamiensis]
MGNEIELISDGEGLAVVGDPVAVEQFLDSEGLASKELELPRLGAVASAGAKAAQAGSEVMANSGRWVKLTEDSAQKVKKFGLMDSKTPGVKHAMVGQPGDIKSWLQISKAPGALAANPAMLAGAAGIMAQVAMEQTMAEITDYLAIIDEKLDDVLRAQTNQVLARMDGVELAIKEATSVRNTVGRVSEVTWSKVQNSSGTIHETQGYALRQLADLADKLEKKSKIEDLVKIAREAESEVQKWLAVLARCFQLQDAVAVLELDRVLDASPDELDRHRLGLKAARQDRLELIVESTERLVLRMSDAVDTANSKVLFNPIQSPAIVKASNRVALDVHEFHGLLEIESEHRSSESTKWKDAAAERWDKTRETGAGGLDAAKNLGSGGLDTAKNLGSGALGQAASVKNKLSGKIPGRKFRRRVDDESEGPD